MKQLGNLAVICAQRPPRRAGAAAARAAWPRQEQTRGGAAMEAAWNDDARIERMIYELNFGTFSKERLV